MSYKPWGSVPIGAIIAWAKYLTVIPALPEEYVECNGQTLTDTASPFAGTVLPDLNDLSNDGDGFKYFLRGNKDAGSYGGCDTHCHTADFCGNIGCTDSAQANVNDNGHTHSFSTGSPSSTTSVTQVTQDTSVGDSGHSHSGSTDCGCASISDYGHSHSLSNISITCLCTYTQSNLPPFYDIVWVIRYK